ncbi:sulfatase-like hydrolase/transferase [Sphingomonas sp. Leaf32]|uniref:sulfatase-like hydrolase/transferase n=2 Tax=Sphingomonas TaxID=13687 RepID=UPI0009EAEF87|nr:sulfatase-like hydrolase/transferase [Sphingomonas sp. Leaf32]
MEISPSRNYIKIISEKENRYLDRYLFVFGGLTYFLFVNFVRMIVLHGTGEATFFQIDYAIPPVFVWIARRININRFFIRIISFFLVLLTLSADIICLVGRQFRWGIDAIPQYIGSYQDLPWPILLPISLGILILSIIFTAALKGLSRCNSSIWPLILCVTILLVADASIGTSRFRSNASGINLITTALTDIGPMYAGSSLKGGALRKLRNGTMYVDLRSAPLPPQILSVAVESFGWAQDPAQRASLVEPLMRNLSNYYTIEYNTHEYFGTTLQGEIRELCGARLVGNATSPTVMRRLPRCLPATMHHQGYDTQSIHGNGSRFYSRFTVYPTMGFQKSWFYDELLAQDSQITPCKNTSFRGACDAFVFRRALNLFDGRKRFVHLMTLDSHLPINDSVTTGCPPGFEKNPQLCSYAYLIRRSLNELSNNVITAKYRPNLIIIFGDHAPPFMSNSARRAFSKDKVPYIVLRLKNNS